MSLSHLPTDLLGDCLAFLDLDDLRATEAACRRTRALVRSRQLWAAPGFTGPPHLWLFCQQPRHPPLGHRWGTVGDALRDGSFFVAFFSPEFGVFQYCG